MSPPSLFNDLEQFAIAVAIVIVGVLWNNINFQFKANNISTAEAHSEPSHISEMELFCKQMKAINYFCKKLHLKCLAGS